MPFVTFTVRRGLSAADKSRLSEAMLEAQVAAGYHQADRFHRFLEVDQDDLLVDPRFPDYATDRTDRFMVVEVVISSGRPTGTAATIADEAVRLFADFQLPTISVPTMAPSAMSVRRDRPRHITVLPGGGSLARAGIPRHEQPDNRRQELP